MDWDAFNAAMPAQFKVDVEKLKLKQAIEIALQTCEKIIHSGMLEAKHVPHIVFESAFAYLLACLSDALQKLKRAKMSVAFDDEMPVGYEEKNVTDLIADCRNAACHVNSPEREIATNYFTPIVLTKKNPRYLVVNGVEYGNDYDDDVAILFGDKRIYLRRHIERALNEARSALASMK